VPNPAGLETAKGKAGKDKLNVGRHQNSTDAIVNYAELQLSFSDSAQLRLLRADNAQLVLAVLFAAFKHDHASTIPESRLRAILEAELEELHDAGESTANKKAREYLLEWADQAHGYLRRHTKHFVSSSA
jgi:hypothetical protein